MTTQQTASATEPTDYPQGWYHVFVSYTPGHKPPVVDLAELAKVLPHGSGINGDWRLYVRSNGDVAVTGGYHMTNEYGDYCNWKRFKFVLGRAHRTKYVPLLGPCAGQYQITHIRGNVYFRAFSGGGESRNYLYDTCYWPIADNLYIRNMEQGVIVGSEMEAVGYVGGAR